MGNTLTYLLPTIYAGLNRVSREMVGFIPAVSRDTGLQKAVVGQTVRWPVAPANTADALTPAYIGPNATAQTIGSGNITLSKLYGASFPWTGEEIAGGRQAGWIDQLMAQQFEQIFRSIVNQIEADLAGLYKYGSRACLTSGLTLFDETDKLNAFAQLNRILNDNGAGGDRHVVLSNSAWAALEGSDSMNKVNEAGTDVTAREGYFARTHGFQVHQSGGISAHTNGDFTAPVVTTLAEDGTAIVGTDLDDLLDGDLIKIATDDNNIYVLQDATSAVAAVINSPGSKVAHAAATDAISEVITDYYIPNMAFTRDAIALVARVPNEPEGGDMASEVQVVVDPKSGIPFRVAKYRQYHQVSYEVSAVWGAAIVKSDNLAILAEAV
jgi:hypothetical protein